MSLSLDDIIEWSGKNDPFKTKDGAGAKPIEWGTPEDIKERLITLLDGCVKQLRDGMTPEMACLSDTWPWTKMGLDLVKAISMCEAMLREADSRK